MLRRSLALLLTVLALAAAGCGGGSGGPSGSGADDAAPLLLLDTQQAPVTATSGGTVASDLGHQVTFPAGSLDQDALVTLQVLSGAPEGPADPDFQPLGHYLQVDLGDASLVGPATFTIQVHGAPATTVMTWREDGVSIPLDTRVSGNLVTGTLEGQPVLPRQDGAAPRLDDDTVEVGLVDTLGFASRPAHQDWPSYNLYVYQQSITQHGEVDQFVQVVNQGAVVGPMPDLGDRPLLVVHGLGSSIRGQGFVPLAKYLALNGDYSAVIGFEYDTLNQITHNGEFLHQAYEQLNALSPGLAWHHVAHSMGSLVSRSCFEQKGPLGIAATGNRVVTVCGPHLGSPVIPVIQGHPNLLQRAVLYLVMNDFMEFTNADLKPCQVTGLEPGFTDLRPDSAFLAALNPGAAGHHPQEEYSTIGGNSRGLEYDGLDFIAFGIHTSRYPNDGLVDLVSANPSPSNPSPNNLDIGAQARRVVDENHSTAVTATASIQVINSLLLP